MNHENKDIHRTIAHSQAKQFISIVESHSSFHSTVDMYFDFWFISSRYRLEIIVKKACHTDDDEFLNMNILCLILELSELEIRMNLNEYTIFVSQKLTDLSH